MVFHVKQALDEYVRLVLNGPHGLLSTSDRARIDDHVADALAGLPQLVDRHVASLVDVGSGAGLPGLPLAIALPDCDIHLVESQKWKAEFLRACVRELNLTTRVHVWPERAEAAVEEIGRESLDAATCRALAAPATALEYLSPFVRPGGVVILWTTTAVTATPIPPSTLEPLGLAAPLAVPAPSPLRDDGVLLVVPKALPCNRRFPRRVGVAAKRPLQ